MYRFESSLSLPPNEPPTVLWITRMREVGRSRTSAKAQQRAVYRMHRCPQRELAGAVHCSHARHRLHRGVILVGRLVDRLVDHSRLGEAGLHVTAVEGDVARDVAGAGVDFRRAWRERRTRVEHRRQFLVVDPYLLQRVQRGVLVGRHDRGHLLTDEAHLVDGEHVLVLADDSPGLRRVGAGEHRLHAWGAPRRLDIDVANARVGVRAAQDLGVQHARQLEIRRVQRRTADFLPRVDGRDRLADRRRIVPRHWPPALSLRPSDWQRSPPKADRPFP